MALNKDWHLQNRMPKNPTVEEKIKWHLEHQKNCTCFPIPKSILELIADEEEIKGKG